MTNNFPIKESLILLLLIILQVAFLPEFIFFPNLVFLFIFILIIGRGDLSLMTIFSFSVLAGLSLDIFLNLPFGAMFFTLVLTVLFSYLLIHHFLGGLNPLTLLILALLTSLFYNLSFIGYLYLFKAFSWPMIYGFFLKKLFIDMAWSLILIFLFFYVSRFRKILY